MRHALVMVNGLCLLSATALYAGQATRLLKPAAPASVGGRVTVVETIGKKTMTNPVTHLTVYLLTLEASKPFQDLQIKCRRAMARPDADPVQTFKLCDRCLSEAFDLVPHLEAVATAETDRDGSFRFENLAPNRRYHVVGIKPPEGGSPIVVEAKIGQLRAGQRVALELSENDPWTGPLELKWVFGLRC